MHYFCDIVFLCKTSPSSALVMYPLSSLLRYGLTLINVKNLWIGYYGKYALDVVTDDTITVFYYYSIYI
jgi:hypothetical protein